MAFSLTALQQILLKRAETASELPLDSITFLFRLIDESWTQLLDELVIRLLAVPFALGALLIFAWTASKRPRFQEARRDFVVRREAPRLVEAAWTVVFVMVPVLFIVPPVFPVIVYANFLSIDFPNSEIAQLIGYALVAVGAVLLVYAERTLGRFVMREIGIKGA